jgi:DNA-binding MarR family transcriptional regulator
MRNTKETREFLAAIVEEGGTATTRQIRRRTDLTEGQLHHQYRKLERHGYITISRAFPTESGSQMKQATLTEVAEDKINNKALLSHGQKPNRVSVDVVELSEDIDTLASSIEDIQEWISETLYPIVKENSMRLDTLERTEDSDA